MKIWNQLLRIFSNFFSKKSTSTKKILLKINSKHLKRVVLVEFYFPSLNSKDWSLLILNDGQDGEALSLQERHSSFNLKKNALAIAAVHAADRIAEYGTPNILDYKGRGQKSAAYQEFILTELIPTLKDSYPISESRTKVGIAGFSLGGLSAMAIAWNNPATFGLAGIFSGALWWRSMAFDPSDPDANRIMHESVLAEREKRKSSKLNAQRFWFQTGTEDELEDRNGNGVIDSIDDTLDLIKILSDVLPKNDTHLKYVEVEKGRHEPATWSAELIGFLEWGYGE